MTTREYSISGSIRGCTHFGTVVASSAKEALEKVQQEWDIGVSFCHQCSSGCEDPETISINAEAWLDVGTYDTASEDLSGDGSDLAQAKLDQIRAWAESHPRFSKRILEILDK